MTLNADIPELAAALGICAPGALIEQLKKDVQEELKSLSLFAGVKPSLTRLTERGTPLAICSNLAAPYGEAVDLLLGDFKFLRCLSYDVGFIKPEAGICQFLITQANVSRQSCFLLVILF